MRKVGYKGFINIILILVLVGGFTFVFNRKLSGRINLHKYHLLKSIEESTSVNELGNYIFLMSSEPNAVEAKDSWYKNPSFLFVTNDNLMIKNVIKLDGYYEQIALIDNDLYVFTPKNDDTEYRKYFTHPVSEVSHYENGKFGKFEPTDKVLKDVKHPDVTINDNQITLIDEQKVQILNDPKFKYNDYQYEVSDFTQNTKS